MAAGQTLKNDILCLGSQEPSGGAVGRYTLLLFTHYEINEAAATVEKVLRGWQDPSVQHSGPTAGHTV